MNGYPEQGVGILSVFEDHQHSKGLGGSLTPQTYSPGSIVEPSQGIARYVGRHLSSPSKDWYVLKEVNP